MVNLHLIVIRTGQPDLLKSQYELLGLKFTYHRHGMGPYHYSAEMEGLVFEIYPLKDSLEKTDGSLRLGFSVADPGLTLERVRKSDWIIKSELKETAWGKLAVIQDLDGRKVELKSI